MKRFLLIVFPIIIFVLVLAFGAAPLSSFFKGEDETYSAADLGFVLEEEEGGVLNYISEGEVVGQCVSLLGGIGRANVVSQKLGLTITKKYTAGGRTIIEGVSPLLKFYLSGRRENVQISICGDEIVVGSPIIYGSY